LPQQAPSAVKAAFVTFLQRKYGYKSGPDRSVECVVEPPSVGRFRAAQMNKRYAGEYATWDKKQLVKTGWMNTSSEAATTHTPAEVAATKH